MGSGNGEANKAPLLNLSLEAIATLNYQEKLKRDRIGIIFQKAKTRAWDTYKEFYHKNKGKKDARQLMDNFIVQNLKESAVPTQKEMGSDQQNRQKLHLVEDQLSSHGVFDPQSHQELKQLNDRNIEFENRIYADEREFVNYEQMF